ncbi:MAG: UPF0280 family protein [Pseudomonadota bacterium]
MAMTQKLTLRLPASWPAGAAAALLPDGRLHLQHGPIDLVISAEGTPRDVATAYKSATEAFAPVLHDLVGELPALRRPALAHPAFDGAVAQRMAAAAGPLAAITFVTPMAAVAGAVADHVLAAMLASAPLRRAIVNNGGDIALALAEGERCRLGLVTNPDPGAAKAAGAVEITAGTGIGGVATSGWRGRSHSLGIADAVTVFARSAAEADVAATLIANAVDLPEAPSLAPYVTRTPASTLSPDSDLGDRLVTEDVRPLPDDLADRALARGRAFAARLHNAGHILGAILTLGDRIALAGQPPIQQAIEEPA